MKYQGHTIKYSMFIWPCEILVTWPCLPILNGFVPPRSHLKSINICSTLHRLQLQINPGRLNMYSKLLFSFCNSSYLTRYPVWEGPLNFWLEKLFYAWYSYSYGSGKRSQPSPILIRQWGLGAAWLEAVRFVRLDFIVIN